MPDDAAITRADLRALYGEPSELAAKKAIPRLDRHCRRFIELSPFCVLATADASGAMDCSPRGDAPGFVRVVDDTTLLIPDRVGNNRVDSLTNVAENPEVALIFFIPGVNETLRVNGKAAIVTDPDVLAPLEANRRVPKTALRVAVDETFLHCSKALVRSRLWDEESKVERGVLPPLGRMIAEQVGGIDGDAAEAAVQHSLKTRLY